MKYILIAFGTIVIFATIGTVTDNRGGGFIVGVVLAIMLVKWLKSNESKKSV